VAATYQHRHICPLATAIGMEFIEDQKSHPSGLLDKFTFFNPRQDATLEQLNLLSTPQSNEKRGQ